MQTLREKANEWVTKNNDSEVRRMYGHYFRAFLAGAKSNQPEIAELEKILNFLSGEGELDGLSFGDGKPGMPFWWRKPLREAFERLKLASIDSETPPVQVIQEISKSMNEQIDATGHA